MKRKRGRYTPKKTNPVAKMAVKARESMLLGAAKACAYCGVKCQMREHTLANGRTVTLVSIEHEPRCRYWSKARNQQRLDELAGPIHRPADVRRAL